MQILTALQRYTLTALLAFVAGLWTMRTIQRKTDPRPEPPAAAVVQADRSVILERNPATARPPLPQIPKKEKVERVTTVTVQPEQPGPVSVVLTQIRTDEGTRVIASTADGLVIGGQDFTAPAPGPPRPYRWQLLAVRSFSMDRAAWGASLGYSRGPFVGSVTLIPGTGGQVLLGAGIRW